MVFKIVITHNAHIDTLEGIEWYNKQSSIIGKRFYQTIQKNSERYHITHISRLDMKMFVVYH
jgi:hypothetical protein